MEISIINNKNKNLFTEVIPAHILGEFVSKHFYGLGIIQSVNGKEYAAGAICFFIRDTTCRIEWLYIAPNFRDRCFSLELMNALYTFCGSFGVKNYLCYVPNDPLYDDIGSFLLEHNFQMRETALWHTYLDSAYICDAFRFLHTDSSYLTSGLQRFKTSELKKYLGKVTGQSHSGNASQLNPEELLCQLDTDLSQIITDEKGNLLACLLVRVLASDYLEIVRFQTSNKLSQSDTISLMANCIEAFRQKYDSKTVVHLILDGENKIKLMEFLFEQFYYEPLIKFELPESPATA